MSFTRDANVPSRNAGCGRMPVFEHQAQPCRASVDVFGISLMARVAARAPRRERELNKNAGSNIWPAGPANKLGG